MHRAIGLGVKSAVRILPFKRRIFSAVRRLNPPKRIWNLLRFEGKFEVEVAERLSFYMNHYGYGFENGIFWNGLFRGWGEEQSLRLWIRLCTHARTVLDVGANVGVYSLLAKTVNPESQVYGFEAVQHLHEKFERNCELNGFDIRCVHTAVSNVDGFADIFSTPGGFATASLQTNALRTTSERVTTTTLTTFIESQSISRVDLMKIDVEGYEPQVLEGMGEHLVVMKPTILVEILTDEAGRKVESVVAPCAYLFFKIDEIRGPIKCPRLTIEGRSRHSRNFLPCSEAIAEELDLEY
jgi:FkbM family methyltransferase